MFLLEFIRWLRGTVTFLITGAFPEKLISMCKKNGFPVWRIKRVQNGIKADTYSSEYKRLRPMAKITSTKIRIQEKHGMTIWRHRYRKRIGALIGIALSVLLLFCASLRVWRVEISGCSEQLANDIRSELFYHGVKIGALKSTINQDVLKKELMLADERIAWITINIVGSTALVEISERDIPPQPLDPSDKAANVVAKCDGQIKYMEVYEGQPLVSVGETVCKGDVIVSGIMEDKYGKKQFKYARAKIIAQAYEQNTAKVLLKQYVWKPYKSEATRLFLKSGDKLIPLFWGREPQGPCSITEQNGKLWLFDTVTREYTPCIKKEIILSEQQAKEYAMNILDKNEGSLSDEKVILREREGVLQSDAYVLTERKLVEKDIAQSIEILWR